MIDSCGIRQGNPARDSSIPKAKSVGESYPTRAECAFPYAGLFSNFAMHLMSRKKVESRAMVIFPHSTNQIIDLRRYPRGRQFVNSPSCHVNILIIHMKKLLDSDWLRAV